MSAILSVPVLTAAGTVLGTIDLPAPPTEPHGASLYGKYRERTPDHHPAPAMGQGVVCLVPKDGAAPRVHRSVPTMDQKDKEFVPRILPVQVGEQIRFHNSDKLFHNVFSLSPAKRFDLGRSPQGNTRTLTFEKAGIVQVFCDIHPHMVGFVVVLQSPYFAVVDPDGSYRIPDVPAGDYAVQIWGEGMNHMNPAGDVAVPAAGETTFNARLVN